MSNSTSSPTALLLGSLVLGMLGMAGVVGFQGFSSKFDELEGRMAQGPRERKELERSLGALRAELEAVRTDLADTQAQQLSAAELGNRLAGAESRLSDIAGAMEAHGSSLDQLQQTTASFQPEALEARIAEQSEEMANRWESLQERLEAAELTADISSRRLEEVARQSSERDVARMWNDLVGPTVQLAGDNSVGSGVLLRSRADSEESEVFDTHILTAWHVVRDIVEGELDTPVPVTIYLKDGSTRHETAALEQHDALIDIAVLRLDTDEPVSFGTDLPTREAVEATRIFDRVYAVGCPLGNDPIPTPGEVSTLTHQVDDVTYWMINAPTYIGNSGGGIFDADKATTLMGLFSKIYTHGNIRPTIVPHMGLVTPLNTVYDWLDEVGYGELIPGGAAGQVADNG